MPPPSPAPPPSVQSIHLYPSLLQNPNLLLLLRRGRCFGAQRRRVRQCDRRLQSRVRSTSSHGRHMKGCFPEREPNGRDPSKGPVLLFLINTPKRKKKIQPVSNISSRFLNLSSSNGSRPRCRNFAVARCQRLAGGRKRGGRKQRLAGLNCSSGHPAFRSGPARSLTSRQAAYLHAGTCSSAHRGSRVPLPLGRAQRYRVPQIFDPRAHWEVGGG